MMRAVLHLYLMYYIRNFNQAIYSIVFFISSIVLYGFAQTGIAAHQIVQEHTGNIVALHVLFIFSCMLCSSSFWEEEAREGIVDQWPLWPTSLEVIVLIKIIMHWILRILPLCALLPLGAILLSIPSHSVIWSGLTLLLESLPLLMLLALADAFQLHSGRNVALTALFVQPLILPLMLFGIAASSSSLAPGITLGWPALIGMSMFFLPTCFVGIIFLLRHRG